MHVLQMIHMFAMQVAVYVDCRFLAQTINASLPYESFYIGRVKIMPSEYAFKVKTSF